MTLELSGLSVAHGDLVAVRDLNLVVEDGRCTALVGRNGAGKTTALSAIAGLLPARSGSIRLDEEDLTSVPAARRVRKGIGLVQESKQIFRSLTVDENMVLGAYSLRLPKARLRRHLDDIYSTIPLIGDRRATTAGSLSGGQQQMLAIGQALAARPSILLLDEPSAGLAPAIVADVLDLIRGLRDAGLSLLLVEQSVDFALAVADSITMLELGRDVLTCDPADGGVRATLADAYMGATPSAAQ